MITFKNVDVKFADKFVLKDINMEIQKGEFVGILGPNGAGKTTLIKVLLGLIKPSAGVVNINGINPEDFIRNSKNRIGYLPQHAIVNWSMPLTTLDVVLLEKIRIFSLFKKYSKDDVEKALYWLDMLGMADKKDKYIKELSGGQQQRVSLARCLFYDPELLVLDEPNTGIDVVYNAKLYDILTEIKKSKKMTILMVSHDIGTITKYVDEVMCMNVRLHCHNKPDEIDYNRILSDVYGKDTKIVVHKDACKGCGVVEQ